MMNATTRRTLFVPVLLVVAAGCGGRGNPNAPAKITGKVTYNGAPVTGGAIQFHIAGQPPYSAAIGSDGKYSLAQVPTGEAVVTVETESLNPDHKEKDKSGLMEKYKGMMSGPPPGAKVGGAGGYVKIPGKYADAKSSPLKYTVQGGDQKKDWDLTD